MADLPHLLEVGLAGLLIAALAVGCALLLHWLLFATLERLSSRFHGVMGKSLLGHARQPARLTFALAALLLILPALGMTPEAGIRVERLLTVALTIAIGWLAFNLTKTINDVVAARHDIRVVTIHQSHDPGEAAELAAFLASPAGHYYAGCAFTLR